MMTCPVCNQSVAVRITRGRTVILPHFKKPLRFGDKMCSGSGKDLESEARAVTLVSESLRHQVAKASKAHLSNTAPCDVCGQSVRLCPDTRKLLFHPAVFQGGMWGGPRYFGQRTEDCPGGIIPPEGEDG